MKDEAVKISKREQKAIKSKKALLDAAAQLFREKSINSVGVREISAAAGVTTGTFYHYFKSKDEILDKIYEKRDKDYEELIEKLKNESSSYTEAIRSFFVDFLSKMVETDGIDFTTHRMFVLRRKAEKESYMVTGIMKLVDLAKENGELDKKYDSFEISHFLFVVFRGVVYDWCLTHEKIGEGSLAEREDKAIRAAIRAYLAC